MSRRRYLVAYDIADSTRLRKVFDVVKGYGYSLQYSVFLCDLTEIEKLLFRSAIGNVIRHSEDRIAIIDLGDSDGRGTECFEFMGVHPQLPGSGGPTIV